MSSTLFDSPGRTQAILDTNIVLDVFLFSDPRTTTLREQLHSNQLHWIATQHMRNELERVLAYAHIVAKLAFYEKSAADLLAAFDQHANVIPAPETKAPYTCKDADDQVFIDLACHLARHPAQHLAGRIDQSGIDKKIHLISKDKAVTSMRKRLEKLSVFVSSTFSG